MKSALTVAGDNVSAATVCLRFSLLLGLAVALSLPLPALAQNWSEAWFRGTPNDWGTTAMTYDAESGTWVTEQTFDEANPRFKVSRYQNWDEAYPAADYQVQNGRYRIAFDDASKAITVTEVVDPPPASNTQLCFDNTQNYAAPHIYFWNPQPAAGFSNLPGWPGQAVTEQNGFYCYDFAEHLDGPMPDSLNVIFNDNLNGNGASQTEDLLYTGDPCLINGQWQPAEVCGLDQQSEENQPPSERPLLRQPLNFPISGNVSGGNYRFEIAYPNLQGLFMSPVMVVPDGLNDLLYVVDKTGSIFTFPNREDVAAGEVQTLLNISGEVRNYHEQGLLSMAFDPAFASNGYIYIYYIHGTDDNERAPDGSYGDAILERWTVDDPNNPSQVVAGSRVELLRVPQRGPDHKGGMMQFHPEDNYLYLSIGDGAYGHSATMPYPEDPRTNNGAQETDNLLGTFIRIKPLAQPVNGKYYKIPADNPFVGVPGFREEIWSYGHRNPWRWSFDSEAPYTLWETEVGQAGFEEVNLIEKGKNYGWPVCEGTTNRGDLGGDPGKNCSTDFEPPRDGYAHPTGFSIIGGVVYRGGALPGLTGNFIFGDYVTKRIWSIVDGEAKSLISDAFPENIASFGTDLSGETLLVSTYGVEYGGQSTIYKVVDDDAETAVIPTKLSETGLFSDLQNLEPVSGVLEYKLNTDGWFDGTTVRHFIALPNDSQIDFDEIDNWDLPIGTVLVKHQSVATAENPQQPFTTSVLFRQDTGKWQAANYYWNSAGSDADLVNETMTVMDGGLENRQRAVQSAADCGSCHIGSGSREPLVVHTRQLNREFQYGESAQTIANQLDVFNTIGLFTENIGTAQSHAQFVAANEETADLNKRARTYLDTNCSHCHASGFMDLRYDTPLDDTRLLDGETASGTARLRPFDHGNSLVYIYQTTDNNRMPKGTRYTNPVAEALFRNWIDAVGAQQTGIVLQADSDRLNSGDALSVTVKAEFDNGFTTAAGTPSVASSNSSVAAVEAVSAGQFSLRAGDPGSSTVTVQQNGFTATLAIAVTTVDTEITRIEIAPQNLPLETSRQLTAFGVRADGTRQNLFGQVTWSVASGPATVDQSGLVTRTGSGDVSVQAQAGEFSATAVLGEGSNGISVRFDNPDNWEQVFVHLWVTVDGQDQAVTQWPGLLMSGPDQDGWWTHTVEEEDLHDGQINLLFHSGDGQQTDDHRNIAQSSSLVGGAWEPWEIEGPVGGDTSRVSVIGGTTADGGRDYAIGSVITVTADTPPLGTEFSIWSGDAAPYIIGDPSQPQVQLLIPQHDLSLVALFPSSNNAYEAGQTFYGAHCASCHGDEGQGGVAQALAGSGSNWQLADLTQYIEDFMPMDAAASCIGDEPGACAYETARLIVDEAWGSGSCTDSTCDGSNLDQRNLRLLTRLEYLNSVRDIFAIDFDVSLMNPVPADGRYRNFDTASFLTAGNDRTLGYELVAEQVADLAISQSGFLNLVDGCTDVACVVDTVGFRLFRRPLSNEEIANYSPLYSSEDDGRLLLQAMLMSPHFMYRSELGQLDPDTGLYRLDNYEVATLLSYTFWGTTPDDTLLLAATEEDFDVAAQVDRLLADSRAERGLRRFIGGWLINNQYPFPAINSPDLIAAFKEETVGFVLEHIRNDAAYSTLLSTNYTWANEALAAHYGLDTSGGSGWMMRNFPVGAPRSGSGLLGHGSFLASRTGTVNPAPIKRGVYVREVLMCQEFPPPAAADFNVVFEETDSNREATARHTSDPACAACHQFIDGVGFGFEGFGSDALYRTIETIGTGEEREIDDSGSIKSLYTPATVLDPTSPSYDFYSVPELANLIASSDQGEACFARQFYRYVVGREEGASDDQIIHAVSEDLRNGGGMQSMLRTLVLSDAFTLRR